MKADTAPQRIVSLQPSVTVTLERLGLLDRVVACTKYCVDVCPQLKSETKMIVADSWTAQSEQIIAAKPDLVIASVPYQIEAVAEIMKAGIAFLGLAPKSLKDVYADILRIALMMGVAERGEVIVSDMQREIEAVRRRAESLTANEKPLVYCEEWGNPLILSQMWVKELVEAAGAEFYGTPGAKVESYSLLNAEPDVIIAAWCGAGDRVPLEKIIEQRGWQKLRAVIEKRVYCINDEYLNTPAPTLLAGLNALAAAIHPEHFPAPVGLRRIE
jgi:iron complex transport system substrate-binding protein